MGRRANRTTNKSWLLILGAVALVVVGILAVVNSSRLGWQSSVQPTSSLHEVSVPYEELSASSALNGKHEGDDGTGWGYGTVDDGNGDDAESSTADDHDDDAYECSWKCIMCCFKALGFGYDAKIR